METTSTYQSYLNSMKNYEVSQGRKDYQLPCAEGFEAIYSKAKEEEISLSNAKEYLQGLSSDELKTLQKYSGLADSININSLSSEGAYNLLLHDNEHYDFNGDGIAQVGEAQTRLPVPTNMPTDVRDAYISAMNSLKGADRLMASILTFDINHISAEFNNEKYTPQRVDYNYLKTQVESRLNPTGGGYTSPEAKSAITAFWDAFNSTYKGDKAEAQEEQSSDVAQFLKDLRTKGAAQFLADMNAEKIEKLIEEFKEKLLKEMGDSPEALQKIAKLVEDYRKQLMDEMREKTENEAKLEGVKIPTVSSDSVVQMLVEMQQEETKKPLEELLA